MLHEDFIDRIRGASHRWYTIIMGGERRARARPTTVLCRTVSLGDLVLSLARPAEALYRYSGASGS